MKICINCKKQCEAKESPKKDMSTIEALQRCKNEGISIVPARYSAEPKSRVQTYINSDNVLVTQDGNGLPKIKSTINIDEVWEVFTGDYRRFEDVLADETARFYELHNEIGHLSEKFKEYNSLKRKLGLY